MSSCTSQFLFTIVRIPGAQNSWKGLVSMWTKSALCGTGAVEMSIRYVQVSTTPEDKLPDRYAVGIILIVAVAEGARVHTVLARSQADAEGLYRLGYRGHRVPYIPRHQ